MTRYDARDALAYREELFGPSALEKLAQPPWIRRSLWLLAIALPLMLLVSIGVPWEQSAVASGNVVALDPLQREHRVESPLSGRVAQWLVREGEQVEAGQPLVVVEDNDTLRAERIEQQRQASEASRDAAERRLELAAADLEVTRARVELKVAEADSRRAEQERLLRAEEAELWAAERHRTRQEELLAEGLASTRDVELAVAGQEAASESVEARRAVLEASRAALAGAREQARAEIFAAEGRLESARSAVAGAQSSLLDQQTAEARMAQRVITAPVDGRVLYTAGGGIGEQVSAGDLLVRVVPQSLDRAVELWLDGNDVAWVEEGDEVRLLFEGWPALQWVGPPGVSAGTFAGRITFIDSAADTSGRVRAVVQPDPDASDWPSADMLRQGLRAKGFVLLGRVPLGYEAWRRLNGFPPARSVDTGGAPPLPSGKKPRGPAGLK